MDIHLQNVHEEQTNDRVDSEAEEPPEIDIVNHEIKSEHEEVTFEDSENISVDQNQKDEEERKHIRAGWFSHTN